MRHLQAPPLQTSAFEQVRPQPPQLLGLLSVLTQLFPHAVRPGSQLTTHFDCEQTCPAGQTLPQAPQFLLSVASRTH